MNVNAIKEKSKERTAHIINKIKKRYGADIFNNSDWQNIVSKELVKELRDSASWGM